MNKKISSKKSQASIFMILGLLIIIGGTIFIYSTNQAQKPAEQEIKIVQEQVPIEFDPIKKYVTDCAYSVAVEGLKIIGEQGGYISLTNKTLNHEPFTITQNPTESDAVAFSKDSDLIIPYWWYLKSADNCQDNCAFASKRPDLRQTDNSIEKQLERYIDSNIYSCINNFEGFDEQGFKITEKRKPKSDVVIASEDVAVSVDYPITAERQNTKSDISQFFVGIPINLERIYELATKITNMEMQHHYIEKHALNMIVAFSGVSKDKLPPMSDMQFKFGDSISWQKSQVKDKITQVLESYIPLFQVDGTYNYERNIFDSEIKQRLYDSTIIPVANQSFADLAASFAYLGFWPIYFNLNCNGERCTPSSASTIIPFVSFGIQNYNFVYDLSFPVFVEVQDPFALNGEGYGLSFFLEGNVRSNRQMEGNFVPLESLQTSERSQLCDIRNSGDVTVNVVDSAAKKAIEDVNVLYTVTGESCFIGSTDNEGKLVEKFPIGVGGYVNLVKDSYIGKAVEFDADLSSKKLGAEMTPIYTKKVVVKKKNVIKTPQGWQFNGQAADLNEKESAMVTLNRITDENELGFSSVANYEGKKELPDIQIAPGMYTADVSLVLNERIVIPAKGDMPKLDFGEKSAPGEERFPEGGLKLNLTFNPNDLQSHDTIVLYVVSIGIANVPEQDRDTTDIDQISKVEDYSLANHLALQPEFK